MNSSFQVTGIPTGIIRQGDDIAACLIRSVQESLAGNFENDDILVIAETALATAEGQVIALSEVTPGDLARETGLKYGMDPRVAQVVLDESDTVVGGIPGFLLSMKNGTLLPNAGIDASNAPPGCVVLLPRDPDKSAESLRKEIKASCNREIAVIIADSRTHAMRVGCSGVAIGCSGIPSVIDDRGRTDLFGRTLEVTKQALADNLASAAEIVMGEADECTPAALIRGLGIPVSEQSGVETIEAEECLFMGLISRNKDKN
jgi:F420-0:gamma-glutamyl ligase